ncbi:hypothetical protein [Mameliella sediminis]|uniref:hypothetical protein n=1 Tax=Mameliella sediminis TaxID=2836866 RepID=UPI001C439EA2|nr:hypothetical protein [Mameliella sediminis]MBV7394833.1 hypothetical protein [Mameliella sediminis]
MLKKLLVILSLVLAGPALAQDTEQRAFLGNDVYQAGQTVRMSDSGREDAFLAGQRVQILAPVAGTAHMAGRWVDVEAELGGNLYAAGQRIRLAAPIAGDAALAGYTLDISAPVGGDLRAFGSELTLNAPISESAILNGEIVELNAEVSGDAVISARELIFGPDARIGGTLTIFEEEIGATVVPETVVPADRLVRTELKFKRVSGAFQHPKGPKKKKTGELVADFLVWVLIAGAVTALVALVLPSWMSSMRTEIADRPFRVGLIGFLSLSMLTGGGVLVAVTVIGALLTPFFWIAAAALGGLGFVVGLYALGAWGVEYLPISLSDRLTAVAAAFLGALAAGLLGLIPVLGWIVLVLLGIVGAGALAMRLPAVARLAG